MLKPSDSVERSGVRWSTNSQGMRDREYAADKPAGTFRIALVGDSIAAGWGVNVNHRFESILERAWNDRSRRSGGPAVELLDCAVPGHAPGQRWFHFQRIGWPMRPDLIIYSATEADIGWDERRLRFVLSRGMGFDSPLYREALDSAGVASGWSPEQYKHALHPYRREILEGAYRAMAADAGTHGVPVIWVLIPRVGQPTDRSHRDALLAMARAAGFARVVNMSDAFDGMDPARLAVEPDDFHPNAIGHERLAHRLDEVLGAAAGTATTLAPGSPAPMIQQPTCAAAARAALLQPLLLLAAGLIAWPPGWDGVRAVIDCARSPDPGPVEREARAYRYYEDLIEGASGSGTRVVNRPGGWVGFKEADVIRYLDDDFLLFELKPEVRRPLFGQIFQTNAYGMHDDAVAPEKPEGTFRIAVLGASMDMGWGVGFQETYVNRLQQWLTASAGAGRRAGRAGTRCSTSPSPPTARSSGSRPCGARCWRSIPIW